MSQHKHFWNKEYRRGDHLKLSAEPSEDLVGFSRWLLRNEPDARLNGATNVLDIGCGNGRNSIFLSGEYGCRGTGTDISEEALHLAKNAAKKLPLTFVVHSITEPFDLPDSSFDLVLDLMTSHILKDAERERYFSEIGRLLKPGGWFLFKTHLKDGDIHSDRLLKQHSAGENNSYIHPRLKIYEHVWSEGEIREFFKDRFEIVKMLRSHKHILNGKAGKRRTVSVYMRKPY
jgi:SAM-dependent methyltransferase